MAQFSDLPESQTAKICSNALYSGMELHAFTPSTESQRQEDFELEASLSHIATSKPGWAG